MKSINLLLAVLFICICSILQAQNMFQKTYVDLTYGDLISIKQTTDGGFIALYSGDNLDVVLIKMDQNGDISWNKTYGGAGEDVGIDVDQTTDGGYIISGHTNSFGANNSIYVIKTDITGNVIWSKNYGGKGGRALIQQVSDGGYIVCATVDSAGNGFSVADLGLIKIDSSGTLLWSKRYYTPYNDFAQCFTQTYDGGYIIGASSGTYGFAPPDGYMIKTNSMGDIVWERAFVTPNWVDNITSICQTADSNVIFSSGICIGKMTENGIPLWTKQFDYSGNRVAVINGIRPISNGDYIVYGYFFDTVTSVVDNFFSKLDFNGNSLWAHTIQNCKSINTAGQSFDGGFYFASSTKSGNQKGYMIKTDANGNAPCEIANEIVNVSAVNLNVGNYSPVVSNNMSETVVNTIVGTPNITTSNPCALAINNQLTESPIIPTPNPFTTSLSINQTSSFGELTLIDVSGKEMLKQKADDGNTIINTSFLPSGFYIIRYNEKDKTANFKIMKY